MNKRKYQLMLFSLSMALVYSLGMQSYLSNKYQQVSLTRIIQPIKVGQVIQPSDLASIEMLQANIPANSVKFAYSEQIIGMVASVQLEPGDILRQSDLANPGQHKNSSVPTGYQLIPIPSDDINNFVNASSDSLHYLDLWAGSGQTEPYLVLSNIQIWNSELLSNGYNESEIITYLLIPTHYVSTILKALYHESHWFTLSNPPQEESRNEMPIVRIHQQIGETDEVALLP